ncbi:hypothetical protein DSUL_50252 [Desulfovibrionales bacterium]
MGPWTLSRFERLESSFKEAIMADLCVRMLVIVVLVAALVGCDITISDLCSV